MNIKRILIASSLCAVLLSTGCSGAPVTRSTAANDTSARTQVTRSSNSYGAQNNGYRARNRFGSPLGRGYNVRTNLAESNLRIGDELTPSYSRDVNFNTPRRSTAPITQTRAQERTTETKNTENTKKQAPGSAAKVRATKATENLHRTSAETRKNAEQQISRNHTSSEAKAKETKHTPQTVKTNNTTINRSAETLRTPQHSSNFAPHTNGRAVTHRATNHRATTHRANPRHNYSNVERGIVRTRNTANEALVNGHGLNNHVAPSTYRAGRTENRAFLRGYGYGNGHIRRNARNARYGSQGYVLNYNNGYDGVIRDYRFGDDFGYGRGYGHNYGYNYGHNYTRRSHANYPMHHGYSPIRAVSNAVARGTDVLRDGARHTGLFRSNGINRGIARSRYESPMFGYGYNYENSTVNHPYRYRAGTAGHFNGQIVNVPYTPGVVAGS